MFLISREDTLISKYPEVHNCKFEDKLILRAVIYLSEKEQNTEVYPCMHEHKGKLTTFIFDQNLLLWYKVKKKKPKLLLKALNVKLKGLVLIVRDTVPYNEIAEKELMRQLKILQKV